MPAGWRSRSDVVALRVAPAVFLTLGACLFGLFTFLIGRAVRDRREVACFCFGDARQVVSRFAFGRAAALTVLAATLAAVELRSDAAYPSSGRVALQAAALSVLGTGSLLWAARRLAQDNSRLGAAFELHRQRVAGAAEGAS